MIWNQSFLYPTISQRRIGLSKREKWDGGRKKHNQNKLNSKNIERREKQVDQEDSTMVETMAVESGPIKVAIFADGCSGIRMRKFTEISFLDGPEVGHSRSLFGGETSPSPIPISISNDPKNPIIALRYAYFHLFSSS